MARKRIELAGWREVKEDMAKKKTPTRDVISLRIN
jgi:hypothetical protein